MSETDWAELQNFENIKQQLDVAKATGLDKKITFLEAYEAFIEEKINFLKPNAAAGLETEDEKRKKDGATAAAAMVMEQQQREISHFAEHGFASTEQFLSFSDRFRDKDFVAAFEAKPLEEKEALAEKMKVEYDKLDDEQKRKYPPEALEVIKKYAGEKNVQQTLSNNEEVAKLVAATNQLGSDEVLELGKDQREKNSAYAWVAGDINQEAVSTSSEHKQVLAEQLVTSIKLNDEVHDTAQKHGIANHKAEFEGKEYDKNAQDEDLFASLDVKDLAKPLQKAGMEGESATAATKATQVQIADNAAGKDSGAILS